MQNNTSQEQSTDDLSYWQHYDFTKDPFAEIQETENWYVSPEWEQHLDHIHHLIDTENVLVAITGEEGVGKTTLMQQFAQQFDDSLTLHEVEAEPTWDNRKLIQVLYQGFQLKSQISDVITEELEYIVEQIQYKDTTSLLIIDNAENLTLDVLKPLLFMLEQQSENQMRLHVVLIGNQQLKSNLDKLQDELSPDNLIHTIDLLPFTLEETTHYLDHLFLQAGATDYMPITTAEIKKIHKNSAGIPARINNLTKAQLLKNIQKEQVSMPIKFLQMNQNKLIGGFVIVCLFAALVIFLSQQTEPTTVIKQYSKSELTVAQKTNKAPEVKQLSTATKALVDHEKGNVASVNHTNQPTQNLALQKNISNQKRMEVASVNKTNQPTQNLATQKHISNPKKMEVASVNNASQPTRPPTTQKSISIQKKVEVASVNIHHPVKKPAIIQPSPKEIAKAEKLVDQLININVKPKAINSQPIKKIATSPTHNKRQDNSLNKKSEAHTRLQSHKTKQAVAHTGKPHIKKVKVVAQRSAKKTAKHHAQRAKEKRFAAIKFPVKLLSSKRLTSLAKSQRQLLALSKNYYTLQILALNDRQALKNFVNRHRLGSFVYYYHRKDKKKGAYVLLFGAFQTYAEAKSAKDNLPVDLKRQRPWARNLASVQHDIRQKG